MSPLASVAGARLSSSTATQQGIVTNGLFWYIDANNPISTGNDDATNFYSLRTDGLSANTTYTGTWGNKPTLVGITTMGTSYWDFDGVDDYGFIVDSDENTGFDPSLTDAITTEIWTYPDYTGGYDYWIGRYNQTTNSQKSWFMSTYNGDYTGYLWNSTGGYARAISTEIMQQGVFGGWQHIVWAFTNNDPDNPGNYVWNYYKDGALDETNTGSSYTDRPVSAGSRNVQLGLVYAYSRCYNGRISIMRQYSRFLSLNEAKRNFNAECAMHGRNPV
tara:strand:- start:621 stop:1445 length:825 start_codon:yes stop_codon:yes gene_type:complete